MTHSTCFVFYVQVVPSIFYLQYVLVCVDFTWEREQCLQNVEFNFLLIIVGNIQNIFQLE